MVPYTLRMLQIVNDHHHAPESLHHLHIAEMVYQHEIEEKGVLKWCTRSPFKPFQTFETVSKL